MLRVLLVEDNGIFREAFKNSLFERFPSILIEEAVNSDEALQKVNGVPFDLIFVDIRLPGMNGLQLTQKIKRDLPNVHIAILTGYDLPEYRQASVQYGAEGFFVKETLGWDEVVAFVESIAPGESVPGF